MTNFNHVANYCMDNPEHPMFRQRDGARCVVCDGMVNVKPVTKEQYRGLPTYHYLRKQKIKEEKPKHKQILESMGIDLDTKRFQLKLRAIAKHTEALANELDAIDNAWQCDCGSTEYVDESLINSETDAVIYENRVCNDCGLAYVITDNSEGSEQ